MDYGRMIRQAWGITWHYRFLWLLGVLAGGAVGMPGFGGGGSNGWRAQRSDLEGISARLSAAGSSSLPGRRSMAQCSLAWPRRAWPSCRRCLVLSFVAQGGMAYATADLAQSVVA